MQQDALALSIVVKAVCSTWVRKDEGCPWAIDSICSGHLLCSSSSEEPRAFPDAEYGAHSKIGIHYAAAIQGVESHLFQISLLLAAIALAWHSLHKTTPHGA
jgi:hypothetical protein